MHDFYRGIKLVSDSKQQFSNDDYKNNREFLKQTHGIPKYIFNNFEKIIGEREKLTT